MSDDLKQILSTFLSTARWSQRDLASEAQIHESHLSRILAGARTNAHTRQKLLDACKRCDPSQAIVLPPNMTADFTIEDIIKLKLNADFDRSAISGPGLVSAKHDYQTRVDAVSSIQRFKLVRQFKELSGYDQLRRDVPVLARLAHVGGPTNEIDNDVKIVREYVENRGALRVSCAILPGPLATMYAMRTKHGINMDIDVEHGSGVELMHGVFEGKGKPYDFFVVATGAFNLTLVGARNVTRYRPRLMVCYEDQEYLYRPWRPTRGAPKMAVVTDYLDSSGHEERIVRAQELGNVESRSMDHFTSLVRMFPTIDEGMAVNVWDPLSVVLRKRFGWANAVLRPYRSLICLYQHERFSRTSFDSVGDSFQRFFVYQWNRLKHSREEALGFLYGNRHLAQQFWRGAGLDVQA
jgi:hypothetical protein